MKNKYLFMLLVLVLGLPLSSEGARESSTKMPGEQEAGLPLIITDTLGREVILSEPPQRILQAGPSAFIVNDALFLFPEARERVIAMVNSDQGRGSFLKSVDPDYDEMIILPRTINMEEILAADPDVVVLKNFLQNKYDREFQKVGIPVVYLDLESPGAWQKDLRVLGFLFDNPERADQLEYLFSQYIGRVEGPLANLPPEDRKKGLILYYSEKDGTGAFQVPPLNFIQFKMLKMAGSDPVWSDADLGSSWTKVGFEQIAAWDPDQIFLISYRKPMEEVLKKIDGDGFWRELRAYREGEIHPFPGDFYSWDQPDSRWLLGLQWLANRTHPERFLKVDMHRVLEDFFSDFYNITEEEYRRSILPVLWGVTP